ncbi:class I SAM-dependent methyltransferase [Mesorhizobium sp. SB112]|uniref:O-methyltransferase n=1 Tax=Mesorhizobium sp. SB112 TaxID=3151853 RepID=UPI003264DE08
MELAATARAMLNRYRNGRDIKNALKSAPEELRKSLSASFDKPSNAMLKIEGRRNILLSDPSEISIVDFGAGASTDELSIEEQKKGRFLTSTVALSARASKPELWARFLYNLTINHAAKNVLEMGTCVGISGAYIASALRKTNGRLTTLEGDPERGRISGETFSVLELNEIADVIIGPFHETLNTVLAERGPFDLVFVDGHHDGEATVQYFDILKSHVIQNAIIVFDDIRWSAGMKQGWDRIASQPGVEPVDLGGIGLVRITA